MKLGILKKLGLSTLVVSMVSIPLATTSFANEETMNNSTTPYVNEENQTEPNPDSDLENQENQLEELGNKYGFTLEHESNQSKNLKSTDSSLDLNFNTLDELEAFMKKCTETENNSSKTYNLLDELGKEHILNQQEFIDILDQQNIQYDLDSDGNLNFDYDSLSIDSSMFKDSSNMNISPYAAAKVASKGTANYQYQYDSSEFTLMYKRYMDMKYDWKRVPVGNKPGARQFVRVYNRRAYPVGFTIGTFTPNNYSQKYTNGNHTVTHSVRGLWRLSVGYKGFPANFTRQQVWTFSNSIY